MNPQQLSDQKLYKMCRTYGEQARKWRQKFIGLLPEVYRRELYKKKKFSSIFEFAAKLAGLSEDQVRRVLHIDGIFTDRPVLKSLLENGEVSIHKLARVASIINPENEKFLAEQMKLLPNRALETLVRDIKNESSIDGLDQDKGMGVKNNQQNGLLEPLDGENSVHVHEVRPYAILALGLSKEIVEKLQELQKRGIDINALLLQLLKERELKIAQEKEKITGEISDTSSRYIPVRIKKILREEFGTQCSVPLCRRTAQTIHHTHRFALSKNHNPRFLAPLCQEHHTIAHAIDVKTSEMRIQNGFGGP